MINAIANPQLPKIGERFLGTVVKTAAFGAFVSLVPGKDGLVHISKLGNGKRIGKVEDVVKVGDKIRVEVADIDNRGKISLVPVVEEGAEARAAGDAGAVGRSPAMRPRAEVTADETAEVSRRVTDLSRRGRGPTLPHPRRLPVRPARAGCAWSPRRCRACARCRSGSGSASAPATSRPTRPAPRTTWSTCCSRAPRERSAAAGSPRSSTPSAASSTRSPRRSTPATTRTCSTPICRSRSTSSPMSSPERRWPRPTSRSSASVVLEEIAMRDDDPEDLLGELFDEALFGAHPLAAPVIGTEESIRGDDPRHAARVLAGPVHDPAHGRRRRRQPQPRPRRRPGGRGADRGVRRAGRRRRSAASRRGRRAGGARGPPGAGAAPRRTPSRRT